MPTWIHTVTALVQNRADQGKADIHRRGLNSSQDNNQTRNVVIRHENYELHYNNVSTIKLTHENNDEILSYSHARQTMAT